MFNTPPEILFIRTLKGAPLSIICLLNTIDESFNTRALCVATDYPKDEVETALLMLSEMGLVIQRSNGKWVGRYTVSSFFSPDFINPPALICPN